MHVVLTLADSMFMQMLQRTLQTKQNRVAQRALLFSVGTDLLVCLGLPLCHAFRVDNCDCFLSKWLFLDNSDADADIPTSFAGSATYSGAKTWMMQWEMLFCAFA